MNLYHTFVEVFSICCYDVAFHSLTSFLVAIIGIVVTTIFICSFGATFTFVGMRSMRAAVT